MGRAARHWRAPLIFAGPSREGRIFSCLLLLPSPPPLASAIYVWTVSRSSRAIVPLRRTRGRELDRIMLLDEQEEDPKRGPKVT